MTCSRPFTAFGPVALRLGICALVAACVILPVTPPFAAGKASEQPGPRIERSAKNDRLVPRADAPCSARHWNHVATCYLPATAAAPARSVRIVTFERRDGNVSTLERRAVSFDHAK
jgi:hypothetical protein